MAFAESEESLSAISEASPDKDSQPEDLPQAPVLQGVETQV